MTDQQSGNGKPRYNEMDLDRITVIRLHERFWRIDNPLALRIAEELNPLGLEPVSLQIAFLQLSALFKRGNLVPAELSEESLARPLRKLVGKRPRQFLNLLNRLQSVSFRDIVADGPQALHSKLQNRPVLWRLLTPPLKLKATDDIPRVLISNLEYLTSEHPVVPWPFVLSLGSTIPQVTTFGPPFFFIFRSHYSGRVCFGLDKSLRQTAQTGTLHLFHR